MRIVPQPLRQFTPRFNLGVTQRLLDFNKLTCCRSVKSVYSAPANAKRVAAESHLSTQAIFPTVLLLRVQIDR